MPPAKIPGYYFDESRGRYFKITNGAVRSVAEGSQKYHNNAVQAEKRNQHFDQIEKQEQSKEEKLARKKRRGQGVITNPNGKPYPSPDKLDQRFQCVNWDHMTFLNMKTGTIDLKNVYYKDDMVDLIRHNTIKVEKNHVVPPQGHIEAYHEGYFVVARMTIKEESVLNMAVFSSFESLQVPEQSFYCYVGGDYQNLTRELADKLFMMDEYATVNTRIFAGSEDSGARLNLFQRYRLSGRKYCNVIKFHVFHPKLRFFEDLTLPLMKFLKVQFGKLRKKGHSLGQSFGLDSMEFIESSATSIEEMNKLIKSGAPEYLIRDRLETFLIARDCERPAFVYRAVDFPENKVEDCDVVGGHIVALTTNGQIVYLEWDYNARKFRNFKLFTTGMCLLSCLVKLSGNFIYVRTNDEVLVINYKEKRIERHPFVGLRKLFVLSPTKWIVINRAQIRYYDPGTKEFEFIMTYNNGNNTSQQFEIINNHLIFDVGTKFKVVNLSRAIKDKYAVLELSFDTYKYGPFRDYSLFRILDMGVKHGRTHVGFQFINAADTHTRFESFYI